MTAHCDHTETLLLSASVKRDSITDAIVNAFDYDPYESGVITEIKIPKFPSDYQIGFITGSSGSGKTTILRNVFNWQGGGVKWDLTKSVASNFKDPSDAMDRLGAVGLNSIPTWLKPRNVLSTGEGFRADLAMMLDDGAVIDEFTSVVNRDVAISCCVSLSKYIRKKGIKNVTFASCHDDIIPYLQPDWIYNTDTCEFYSGRYLRQPQITIEIVSCTKHAWDTFKRHHYLSGNLNGSSKCYMGIYNDIPVSFCAVLSLPVGSLKHAFKEHRLVVLPDFQGMGIGNKFSEAIADAYVSAGCRYFSKTANPRVGQHRDNSTLWRATSKNHVLRKDYLRPNQNDFHNMIQSAQPHAFRDCFSHEYIGDGSKHEFSYYDDGFRQMTMFDLVNKQEEQKQ